MIALGIIIIFIILVGGAIYMGAREDSKKK
jgi:hypothetical protein